MAYSKKMDNVIISSTDTTEITTERKYNPEDTIPCRSMVSGKLYINGYRSNILYTWADYGDVIDVEYRDLIYMIRTTNDSSIYEPRIIIEDEDFINQNPKLKEFYDSLYTVTDLYDIIALPANRLKHEVEKLPDGCKNALKGIASTMIDDGRLDSVQKIKILDEVFGTNMLITLIQD